MLSNRIINNTLTGYFVLFLLIGSSLQCGPTRGPGRRRRPGKMTVLVYKQHVPNVSENTIGASGVPEGKISRNDPRFKDLVKNENPNIIFKDEEGTGSDRLMTQRTKDKLQALAVSVMNTWPGVKLRVTEAWDEDNHHCKDSLHYEGRAVDITTSDRDRSKYGMLARLAVEAGFDWVFYESRGHIHCSVKSESSAANNIGGCFSGESSIQSETRGYVQMKDLHTGEKVLSKTVDGVPVFSEVIMFLDKNSQKQATFIHIETEDHFSLEITDKHLIYVSKTNYSDDFSSAYAEEVQVGQFVLVSNSTNNFIPSKVVALTKKTSSGVYAPLTIEGNIVVDGVLTSCYGVMNNEVIAHAAFAPVRAVHWILQYISYPYAIDIGSEGVHWYADALYNIGTQLFDKSVLYRV
ncbi:sonic hedgehog protein-like [Mytilus edulis]|uniref:Hedgehog protein n=1 Tax=Mytilus galloprovincialis TaxID=29158 RepID=A0A8B6FEP3_MYTGA|nr:Hypothetical predicted protein [Mytilus galloprovincialis]